jgi:hypothetical protein
VSISHHFHPPAYPVGPSSEAGIEKINKERTVPGVRGSPLGNFFITAIFGNLSFKALRSGPVPGLLFSDGDMFAPFYLPPV